jgi:hypothetical protein
VSSWSVKGVVTGRKTIATIIMGHSRHLAIEGVFQGFAAVALVCSAAVLLTALVFPAMRSRLFMQIIIYISLTNMLAALVSCFGFPTDHSFLCTAQAFFAPYFFISSWLWTTMLAHQLFTVATKAKFGISHAYMQAICWLLPLMWCLLPLSTNRYGRDDDDGEPTSWCYIAGRPHDGELWRIFNFVLPLCVCLSIMIYYSVRTFYLFYSIGLNRPDLYATVHALMLYPLAMILTWGPNLILLMVLSSHAITPASSISILNTSSILCTQSGTITALIFFYKSREARYRWSRLLRQWYCLAWCCMYDIGNANTDSSIVSNELPKTSGDSGYVSSGNYPYPRSHKSYNDIMDDIIPDFDEAGYSDTGSGSASSGAAAASGAEGQTYSHSHSHSNQRYHGASISSSLLSQQQLSQSQSRHGGGRSSASNRQQSQSQSQQGRGSLNTILLLMFGDGDRLGDVTPPGAVGSGANNNNNNSNTASENNDLGSAATSNSITSPLLRADSYNSNATGWDQYPDDDLRAADTYGNHNKPRTPSSTT